jgi:5-methyltetrahydropteroyltriglutamate--homocysteine methyltransferase
MHVDHIGSFVRSPQLQTAFEHFEAGDLDAATLRAIQDERIPAVIRQQELLGLPFVSDGEFRRTSYIDSFGMVSGWGTDALFRSGQMLAPATERIQLTNNKLLNEYTFAAALASKPVKLAAVNVDQLRLLFDAKASAAAYPDAKAFAQDLLKVSRQMLEAVIQAGCRYIQIDGPSYTRFIDPELRDIVRARGHDPDALLSEAIELDNALIDGFEGVTFGFHFCRGNRAGSAWRRGSYDAIAERAFSTMKHQRLLLEYDDPKREGNFEPLRFVPKNKVAVLGLISTKSKRVETVDELKRRVDEAAEYLPLEQLAVSPQCGFRHGGFNRDEFPDLPTEDEQWRKLEVTIATADQIWG